MGAKWASRLNVTVLKALDTIFNPLSVFLFKRGIDLLEWQPCFELDPEYKKSSNFVSEHCLGWSGDSPHWLKLRSGPDQAILICECWIIEVKRKWMFSSTCHCKEPFNDFRCLFGSQAHYNFLLVCWPFNCPCEIVPCQMTYADPACSQHRH